MYPRTFTSRRRLSAAWPGALLLSLTLGAAFAAPAESPGVYVPPPPLALWEFKRASDTLGWTAEGAGVTNLRVHRGRLKGTAAGDAAALLSPPLALAPHTRQVVEVRLKTSRDTILSVSALGEAGPTAAPQSFEAPITVPLRRDRMRTVRLLPLWHSLDKVKGLRLHLPGAGDFEIERIRIVDLSTLPEPGTEREDDAPAYSGAKPRGPAAPSPHPGPHWNFSWSAEGWNTVSGIDQFQQWIGVLRVETEGNRDGILISPPLKGRAEDLPVLTLRLKTRVRPKDEKSVGFFWIYEGVPQYHFLPIRLRSGEGFQEHVVRLADRPEWRGRIAAVGLNLPPNSLIEVDYVRLGKQAEPDPPPPGDIVIDLQEKPEGQKKESAPKKP